MMYYSLQGFIINRTINKIHADKWHLISLKYQSIQSCHRNLKLPIDRQTDQQTSNIHMT